MCEVLGLSPGATYRVWCCISAVLAVQGYPQVLFKLKANLGYTNPCLKNKVRLEVLKDICFIAEMEEGGREQMNWRSSELGEGRER